MIQTILGGFFGDKKQFFVCKKTKFPNIHVLCTFFSVDCSVPSLFKPTAL